MEAEVLVRALEQYSGDAGKPIAAMVLEHQRMRRAAAGATAAIRRCNAGSFLVNAKALCLIMAEHCRKEEGMVLAMADHYLRPAARFLIDSMRAMEIPICSDYPHAVPARAA
jgi:hemerythrin-like domain-containing protein